MRSLLERNSVGQWSDRIDVQNKPDRRQRYEGQAVIFNSVE